MQPQSFLREHHTMSIPRRQWIFAVIAIAVALLVLGKLVGIILGSRGMDIHLRH
jgi:hypothetical protein